MRATFLLLISIGIATLGCRGDPSAMDRLHRARTRFIDSLNGARITEGRLSWPFPYAPWRAENDAPTVSIDDPEGRARLRVEMELLRAGLETEDPEGTRDVGILDLIQGHLVEALHRLRIAVGSRPSDTRFWNDLAVAHLHDRSGDASSSVFRALDAAARSLELDPEYVPARHNAALTLLSLGLHRQAQAHIEAVQRLEPDSRWYEELIRRASRPPAELWDDDSYGCFQGEWRGAVPLEQIVRDYPEIVRRCGLAALGNWASTLESEPAAAHRSLNFADRAAEVLASRTGDRLMQELVETLHDMADSDMRKRQMAKGVLGFVTAFQDRWEHTKATRKKVAEVEKFSSAPDSIRLRAEHLRDALRYKEAPVEVLERVEDRIENNKHHPWMLGKTYALRGLVRFHLGRNVEAVQDYRKALEIFQNHGEKQDALHAHTLLAEAFEHVGIREAADRHRHEALRQIDLQIDASRRYAMLAETAEAMVRRGLSHGALLVHDELAYLAERLLKSPQGLAHAHWHRSRALARLGRDEQALEDLDHARAAVDQVKDLSRKEQWEADLLLVQGVLSHDDPQSVLRHLDEALTFFKTRGNFYRIAYIHREAAKARLRLSRSDRTHDREQLLAARARALEGMQSIDVVSIDMSDPWSTAWFDQGRAVVDSAVSVELALNDTMQALQRSERGRARFLRKQRSHAKGTPADMETLLDRLRAVREDTAVLYYHVLEKSLVAWFFDREGVEFFQKPLGPDELQDGVDRFIRSVTHGNLAFDFVAASQALHELLIGPVRHRVEQVDRLLVIPDGPIALVPFAALQGADEGMLEIRSRSIRTAPSLSVALDGDGGEALDADSRVLVVAGAGLGTDGSRARASLPAVEREIQEVTILWENAHVLDGLRATRQAIFDSWSDVDIFHFAGHAEDQQPALLLLDDHGGRSQTSALTGAEIKLHDLTDLDLVVLSACKSDSGVVSPSEGPLTLARAFLVAGARTVVASLWSVDDEATAELFMEFHRRLRLGDSPARALQAAQLFMLDHENGQFSAPRYWAGFRVVGG